MSDESQIPLNARVDLVAYKALCEPIDSKDLNKLLFDLRENFANYFGVKETTKKILKDSKDKSAFSDEVGPEKDKADWKKIVWDHYFTGISCDGSTYYKGFGPDSDHFFDSEINPSEDSGPSFSLCSSWALPLDPTRPALPEDVKDQWSKSCDLQYGYRAGIEKGVDIKIPALKDRLRRDIVFLYPNWGGDLSWEKSTDGDKWTGPYGIEKELKELKEEYRHLYWRNFHCDKNEASRWFKPNARFSAIDVGPLKGAYWTDFYKFIPTATENVLNNFLANSKKNLKDVKAVMLDILNEELTRLDYGSSSEEGLSSSTRLILATQIPHKILATDGNEILNDAGNKKYVIEPWRLIKWPHHSGSNPTTFKATALAYAYGRVERALEHIEQPDAKASWPWPFGAWVESEGSVEHQGPSKSLYNWLTEKFDDEHREEIDFTKKGVLHCYRRYPKLCASLRSKKEIVDKACKSVSGELNLEQAFNAVKKVMLKDDLSKYSDSLTNDLNQLEKDIKGLDDFNDKSIKKPAAESIEFIVDALYWKDLVSEEDVNAAFLLGYHNESVLLGNGQKFIGKKTRTRFDKTLLPEPSDLKKMREKMLQDA
ncbi:hypothetical protein [Bifidobacterium sp. UBA744]|uniref:hypothetical protein n=1 Tax=Bifidobacterium sp. UBA744 TaxID=1946112 RepID=UPI0025C2CC66|nr:hypothetical protein [Bifidobacterium sp. UBA744]